MLSQPRAEASKNKNYSWLLLGFGVATSILIAVIVGMFQDDRPSLFGASGAAQETRGEKSS